MNIYLIRHTSVLVEGGTCYGRSDVPLTDRFPREAERVKATLLNHTGKGQYEKLRFISSPLSRCVKLTEYLSSSPVKQDSRLLEYHFGQWEMQKWDAIPPRDFTEWMKDYLNIPCPGGESYHRFYRRCGDFLEELVSQSENQLAIVTHGGVIRAILAHVLKIPLQNVFSLRIDLGSLTQLSFKDSLYQVHFVNRL